MTELKPSKSARKREYLALQKLGEELITLKESDLDSLPLEDNLREAVMEARQIKAHGALRRQKQYIGKLMQDIDAAPVRVAIEDRNRQHATHTREFHQLEILREQLISDGDSALPAALASRYQRS